MSSKDHLSWLRTGAIACLALAGALQTLQIGAFLPADDPWLVWPHSFHLWILEIAALVGAATLWAFHRWSPGLQRWWSGAGAQPRAETLTATLIIIQAALIPAYWLTRNHGIDTLGWLRAAFYPGSELNVPALFASGQLFLAAWFAWKCWHISKAAAWLVAAITCAYMGLDELLMIHERVGQALFGTGLFETGGKASFRIGDWRSFLWILFFAPLAVGLGLWLFSAFRRVLERSELALLVLAAGLFLTGAILFETIQATGATYRSDWWQSNAGQFNLLVEEWLEKLGVAVAVFVFSRRWWRYSLPAERHAVAQQRVAGSTRGETPWLAGQPQKPCE